MNEKELFSSSHSAIIQKDIRSPGRKFGRVGDYDKRRRGEGGKRGGGGGDYDKRREGGKERNRGGR